MIEFERARLNVWNVGGLVVFGLIQAFAIGALYNSQQNANEAAIEANKSAVAEISKLAKDVGEIKTQMPTLQFQSTRHTELITENKVGVIEVNKRVDRVVESFGGKLDGIVDAMNKIATRVEVLASKAQPTSFNP